MKSAAGGAVDRDYLLLYGRLSREQTPRLAQTRHRSAWSQCGRALADLRRLPGHESETSRQGRDPARGMAELHLSSISMHLPVLALCAFSTEDVVIA